MKLNSKDFLKKNQEALNSKSAKIGGYSLALTGIAVGILVAVNVLASSLPKNLTQFDISSQRLYSVTSNTKAVVNNLTKDVQIYWITQSGQEDDTVEKLLNVYGAMSSKLSVVKKDPDVYPTFASQYTSGTVNNNSLVVVCGDKYRYIDYGDIYDSDTSSYYTTGSVSYSFDGEGEITSAINYVAADSLPQIYMTTGHGEASLSTTISEAITKANMETQEFTLLNVDEIPEDADVILINSPTSDFAEEEVEMLKEYVQNGGKLLVYSGPQEEAQLVNLQSLMTDYGVTFEEGIVMEGDRSHYGFSYPYILLPDVASTDITSALVTEKSYVLVPLATGMTIGSSSTGATVTSLLDTSDSSYSKVAGYNMSTAEKEEDDIDGPFSVAVSVEESETEGKIVWVSSDSFTEDQMISYSSGANKDFTLNALSWMTGDDSGVAIASKSMSYSYLTISEAQARLIRIVMIGVIPICYLIYGLDEVLLRRKKQ